MRKIGLFGGSFDPIHIGHLMMAEQARVSAGLDKVIFVPTYSSPFKSFHESKRDAKHRLAMVQMATASNMNFGVSDWEISRAITPSYSVDTLDYYSRKMSDTQLYFLVGSDILQGLKNWKDINRILTLCMFISVSRPGYPSVVPEGFDPSKFIFTGCEFSAVSSSEVRKRTLMGQSIKYLVPENVEHYILKNGLYVK
jgi:nicotinate-nucleotide adenylyltransferase